MKHNVFNQDFCKKVPNTAGELLGSFFGSKTDHTGGLILRQKLKSLSKNRSNFTIRTNYPKVRSESAGFALQ